MGYLEHRPDRSKPYRARFRGPDGRERSKSFELKRDAGRWLTAQKRDLDLGIWVDPVMGRVTVEEWVKKWETTRVNLRASTTVRDDSYMRNLVLPEFGSMEPRSVLPVHVTSWISKLIVAGYAPATTRKAFQLLAGMFKAAEMSRLIAQSPCRDVKLPAVGRREMRFLNEAELRDLLEAIDPRYRVFVLTASHTGLRYGELAGLKVGRLDLLRKRLTVAETLSEVQGKLILGEPKSEASRRSVTLPAFLVEELAQHLSAEGRRDGDDFVFTDPGSGPIRRSNFRRRVWIPAVRASVGEPMRFHDLRHTHAAMLIAADQHPKVIQSRLGHASITTTLNTYGHLMEGLDEAAADALDTRWREHLAAQPRPGGQTEGVVVDLTEVKKAT